MLDGTLAFALTPAASRPPAANTKHPSGSGAGASVTTDPDRKVMGGSVSGDYVTPKGNLGASAGSGPAGNQVEVHGGVNFR